MVNTHVERAKPLIKVEFSKNVSHEVSQAKLMMIPKYLEGMAENGGFEPPIELSPYNGLANRRLQPLGQLSVCVAWAWIG
jgi:hypothetical protein